MDLVVTTGMIYLIGLVIAPILIRIIPGLNKYLQNNINTRNPAVMATVTWPIFAIILFMYHIYKFTVSTINWTSGNGFITQSNEDYEEHHMS